MIVKEKDKRKDQIIKELKSEVSDVNTAVKNLENQLNREEQYSRRNCIYICHYKTWSYKNTRKRSAKHYSMEKICLEKTTVKRCLLILDLDLSH